MNRRCCGEQRGADYIQTKLHSNFTQIKHLTSRPHLRHIKHKSLVVMSSNLPVYCCYSVESHGYVLSALKHTYADIPTHTHPQQFCLLRAHSLPVPLGSPTPQGSVGEARLFYEHNALLSTSNISWAFVYYCSY